MVEARTAALVVLFGVAMWVLVLLARPLNEWKALLLGSMVVGFLLALGTEAGREFFELELPPLLETMAVIGVAVVAIGLMEMGWRLGDWWAHRFGTAADSDIAAAPAGRFVWVDAGRLNQGKVAQILSQLLD
mgnify:CR=1 FL=1